MTENNTEGGSGNSNPAKLREALTGKKGGLYRRLHGKDPGAPEVPSKPSEPEWVTKARNNKLPTQARYPEGEK